MATIEGSQFCCGVYELGDMESWYNDKKKSFNQYLLYPTEGGDEPTTFKTPPSKRHVQDLLDECRWNGYLPRAIHFGDVDRAGSPGDVFAKTLSKMGYRVFKLPLGLNPKSGNKMAMWVWVVNKRSKTIWEAV